MEVYAHSGKQPRLCTQCRLPRLRVLACVVMMGKAAACYSVRAKQCRYSLAISGGNFSK